MSAVLAWTRLDLRRRSRSLLILTQQTATASLVLVVPGAIVAGNPRAE